MKQSLKRLPLAVAILSVLGAAHSAAAQDEPTVALNAMNVVVEKTASGIETVNASSSNAMRNATLVKEFLNEVPGVTIGGTSALDQQIYIRGVGDKSLKITVDGARQENYFFHHSGNLVLDPMFYKTAEVSVGNNSVTLGNNAKGGGVEFTTVDASDLLAAGQTIGGSVKLGYSTNDKEFSKVASVYAKPTQYTDLLLAYGHRESDGGEDARGEHIQGDNLKTQNILAKFSILPSDAHKLTFGYKQLKNTGNYPFRPEFGYGRGPNAGVTYPGYTNSEEYTVNYTYKPSDKFRAELNAYHTEREYMTQGRRGPSIMSIAYDGEVNGLNAKFRSNLSHVGSLDKEVSHQLTYGIEAYEKSTVSSTGASPEEKARSYGVYLEDRIGMGRFSLTPGVRYDRYEAGRLYGKEKFDKVSGAIAGSVKLTDNVDLFAGYTQFFSGPPSPESIHNGSEVYVNPNLKPETGNNTEYGINARFLDVFDKGDAVRLTAKAFKTNLNDTVSTVMVDCATGTGSGSCRSYQNVGDSKVDGYELAARYNTGVMSLAATYSHAESTHSEKGNYPRIVPKDSGDRLSLSATYYGANFDFSTRYNHVASLDRTNVNNYATTHLPSYATVDVFGSYRPAALTGLSLDAGVYNLTNKYYTSHNSTNIDYEMGRNFKVSATYKF